MPRRSASSSHKHAQTRFRFKAPHKTPRTFTKARPSTAQSSEDNDTSDHSPNPANHTPNSSFPRSQQHSTPGIEIPFSESLFDALSDADNAAYWAGVYGQPIHIYPRPSVPADTAPKSTAAPMLRPMSDAEYAAYVQRRLWQNTREGMVEGMRTRARERVRREREEEAQRAKTRAERRRAEKAKQRAAETQKENRDRLEDEMWTARSNEYAASWIVGRAIPWPLLPGRTLDELCEADIEVFFSRLAYAQHVSLASVLKIERLRWHPDKIMQKFGVGAEGDEVDRRVMSRVNEVWRAVDGIWRRVRDAEG